MSSFLSSNWFGTIVSCTIWRVHTFTRSVRRWNASTTENLLKWRISLALVLQAKEQRVRKFRRSRKSKRKSLKKWRLIWSAISFQGSKRWVLIKLPSLPPRFKKFKRIQSLRYRKVRNYRLELMIGQDRHLTLCLNLLMISLRNHISHRSAKRPLDIIILIKMS